jgi:DNA repair protein SbcD/Mre11
MTEKIKFIHSSDFHLDEPIRGLQQLPQPLLETLAEAPYVAAESVFDTAITEKVDFVLLSGGLCNLEQLSARAVAFLVKQFQRLEQKDIFVYWAGAKEDSADQWPGAIKLPRNVIQFHPRSVEHVDFLKENAALVRVIGVGCDSKPVASDLLGCVEDDVFNIVLAHADADVTAFDSDAIDYWAFGGRAESLTEEYENSVMVFPGTPQSREFHSGAPSGFKLVKLNRTRKTNVRTIRSDRVHWCSPFADIQHPMDLDDARNQLGELALQLAGEHSEQTILCQWQLAMSGEGSVNRDCGIEWRAAMLKWLRAEFGMSGNGLWSICIDERPSDDHPSKGYDEETLLGEYLRAVGRYQSDSELRLNLRNYLKDDVPRWETDGLAIVNEQQRAEILSKASLLGVDCLGGQDGPAV